MDRAAQCCYFEISFNPCPNTPMSGKFEHPHDLFFRSEPVLVDIGIGPLAKIYLALPVAQQALSSPRILSTCGPSAGACTETYR